MNVVEQVIAAGPPIECVVDPNVDGPTLWDCPCSECRTIRRHAAWVDQVVQ